MPEISPPPAKITQNGVVKAATPQGVSVFKKDPPPPPPLEPPKTAEDPKPEDAPVETPAGEEPTPPAAAAETPDKKAERAKKLEGLREIATKQREQFDAKQALRTQQVQHTQVLAEKDQRITALEAENAKLKADRDAQDSDYLGWLEKKGIKAKHIAERIAKGEPKDVPPDPETVAIKEKLAAIEREREEEKKQAKADLEREQSARQAELIRTNTVRAWKENPTRYPTLHRTLDSQGELLHETDVFYRWLCNSEDVNPEVQQYARDGGYNIGEILDGLERKFAKRYGKADPGAPSTPVVPSTTPTSVTSRPVGKPKAPTLSQRDASTAASTVLPKDFKKLPEKEQIKAMTAMYSRSKSAPQ